MNNQDDLNSENNYTSKGSKRSFSKKKNWLTFGVYTGIGLLILGVASGGVWAVYHFYLSHLNKLEESPKGHVNYNFKSYSMFSDEANGPVISEANVIEGEPNSFWLGEKGIARLMERFHQDVGYGPEVMLLKNITIGDSNFIDEKNNGVYIGATNQIFINTANFLDAFPYHADEKSNERYIEEKVELVYQILYHEYGHHIAYCYLNSEPFTNEDGSENPFVDKDNYTTNLDKKREVSHWNKDFVEKFKTYLHYDQDMPKYKSRPGFEYVVNDKNNPRSYTGNKRYKSIGEVYNAKDIYDHANGASEPSFPEVENHPGFDGYILAPYQTPFTFNNSVDTENLAYLFSLDEIFTRKYQILNMIYRPTVQDHIEPRQSKRSNTLLGLSNVPNTGFYPEGIYVGEDKNTYPVEIFANTSNYQNIYDFENSFQSLSDQEELRYGRYLWDSPFGNQYFQNEDGSPLDDYSFDLYNLMDKHLGHADGADISLVWNKNTAILKNDYQRTINPDENDHLIRWGGYIPSNSTFDNIVLVDPAKIAPDPQRDPAAYAKYVSNLPKDPLTIQDYTYETKAISSQDPNYGNVSSISAQDHLPLDGSLDNSFYTINEYISEDNLKGKILYFVDDANNDGLISPEEFENKVSLKSVREGENGFTSTWLPQLDRYNTKNILRPVSQQNGGETYVSFKIEGSRS